MKTSEHMMSLSTLAAGHPALLEDFRDVAIGHDTDTRRPTGCTVFLFSQGACASADIRGGAPGTRETALLEPVNTVSKIHGLVLSGGSAYGLDAAGGVMRWLAEHRIGFQLGRRIIPIVPAAVLYDLEVGDAEAYPDAQAGYRACQRAVRLADAQEGSVGAGAGATAGKLFGMERAMKSGIGMMACRVPGTDIVVIAVVAANPVGDIYAPQSPQILAGARADRRGQFLRTTDSMIAAANPDAPHLFASNTTIGAILTNAPLDKAQLQKVAQMGHDGLARTINPIHTPLDGDTLFAVSTARSQASASVGLIGTIAAEVVAAATVRAAMLADSLPGLPCQRDWCAADSAIA